MSADKVPQLPLIPTGNEATDRMQRFWQGVLNPVLRDLAPSLGETILSFLRSAPGAVTGWKNSDGTLKDYKSALIRPASNRGNRDQSAPFPTLAYGRCSEGDVARTLDSMFVAVANQVWRSAALAVPLPIATVGTAYSTTLSASGGTSPYAYAIATGSNAPPGLALSAGGVLSGTPTAHGSFDFQVQVTDAAAVVGVARFSVGIFSATKGDDALRALTIGVLDPDA